jgi:hypothetical protein
VTVCRKLCDARKDVISVVSCSLVHAVLVSSLRGHGGSRDIGGSFVVVDIADEGLGMEFK